MVAEGARALESLFAARESAFEGSVAAVDDGVTLDLGFEFKDFATVRNSARIGFFAVDCGFGI